MNVWKIIAVKDEAGDISPSSKLLCLRVTYIPFLVMSILWTWSRTRALGGVRRAGIILCVRKEMYRVIVWMMLEAVGDTCLVMLVTLACWLIM